jgi:tetratricopeptide (TPR) repeat protein
VARKGDLKSAEALARSATDYASRTEAPVLQADAHYELGEVLAMAGRPLEAADCFERAIALFRGKGDVVSEAKAEQRLLRLK